MRGVSHIPSRNAAANARVARDLSQDQHQLLTVNYSLELENHVPPIFWKCVLQEHVVVENAALIQHAQIVIPPVSAYPVMLIISSHNPISLQKTVIALRVRLTTHLLRQVPHHILIAQLLIVKVHGLTVVKIAKDLTL